MSWLRLTALSVFCFVTACTPLAADDLESTPPRPDAASGDDTELPTTSQGAAGGGADGLEPTGGATDGEPPVGGATVGAPPESETGEGTPCTDEGAERCGGAATGSRQVCTAGAWNAAEPCPPGEVCQQEDGAPPVCQAVAEICKGSAGDAVCDAQGNMTVCSQDGTAGEPLSCGTAKLCQLGLATLRCAQCVPSTDHRCSDNVLEVCAEDGTTFVQKAECTSQDMCNELAGLCTEAFCAANQFACDGDTLTLCNSDGSGYASETPCAPGLCDAPGGDCNLCEPQQKKCDSGVAVTCDATGQNWTPTPCPAGSHCVGAGQCADCINDDHCASLNQECKVGACDLTGSCSAQNAADGTSCTAQGGKPGTCRSGTCACAPQCDGKQCGDDSCGGKCQSMCSSQQQCSDGSCVDCTRDSDCRASGSLDGCRMGVCDDGRCTVENAPSTKTCSTFAGSGTCRNGSCDVCTPSCPADSCGDDGCGGTCRCGANQECSNGQCILELYAICETPAGVSSECGTIANPRGCFILGANPPYCVSNASPCPRGTEKFGASDGPCLVPCVQGGFGGCPRPFSKCEPLYPGNPETPAYCVR